MKFKLSLLLAACFFTLSLVVTDMVYARGRRADSSVLSQNNSDNKEQGKAVCKKCSILKDEGGWCDKCEKGYVIDEEACQQCYMIRSEKKEGDCKVCGKKYKKGKLIK